GAARGVPRPRESVHPRHAGLERRLGDLSRGIDGRRRHHRGAQLPLVRILSDRDGHLSRSHPCLPGGVHADRAPSLRALGSAYMIREFTLGEVWFLVLALRWTVLLTVVAFVAGGVVGL